MIRPWTGEQRSRALARAESEGVELLIVGGGITGAGVLRDAASRGIRALLVERNDFACGTSSRSSKMIHGGLRYIAEGAIGLTRESCRERDLLMRQNPGLVRPLPFLFPAYPGSKTPLWQVRAVLWVYRALANFRSSAASRMLAPAEVVEFSRDLRRRGLRGAGLFTDAQVDDARLVIETLKSARALGGEAVNHAELVGFERDARERLVAVRIHDRSANRIHAVRAQVIVNAAGPSLDGVRALDRKLRRPELRPAKGVHLVIPRDRIHLEAAIAFDTPDDRHAFVLPWDEVVLIGTTDSFSDEVDEPAVHIDEVHYLLSAANQAFPHLALTTNDLRSVFAGVRPLAAAPDESAPSSAVSREHRIYEDPSGLISVAGGKLTTYRATAERIVGRVVKRLPADRRRQLGASRTRELPLREDNSDPVEVEAALTRRFGVAAWRAAHLARSYGEDCERLLFEAGPDLREPIGSSRYLYAEIPWCVATECPMTLCDLLERRLRLAILAEGQGLRQLRKITEVAAAAAGWDDSRAEAEAADYASSVRRRYQIVARDMQPIAASPASSKVAAA